MPRGRPVRGPLTDRRRHEAAGREDERRRVGTGSRHRRHGTRSGRLAALLAVLALAAAVAAPAALADGDPASDYLIGQKIFLPYDAKVPSKQAKELTAVVGSANSQGFPVRVALIWSDYDLGSVTALWRKPRTYARFLGIELSYYFKGHLLVVMPNGLGLYWHGHPVAKGYDTVRSVAVDGSTPGGLAVAATDAVTRLAAASGVTVSSAAKATTVAQRPAGSSSGGRIAIAVGAVVALLLGAAFLLVIRRRAAARRPG